MTARDDDPRLHRLEVTHDSDGEVESVRFVCDGGDDAPCHQWPDCGCETWGEGYHYVEPWDPSDPHKKRAPLPGHEDVPMPTCWIDPWFNETTTTVGEWIDFYDGPDEPSLDAEWLVSGPVSVTFEGDYMTWEYAEVPA